MSGIIGKLTWGACSACQHHGINNGCTADSIGIERNGVDVLCSKYKSKDTITHCTQCGDVLNPKSDFDLCHFCHEGTTRPEYSSEVDEQ